MKKLISYLVGAGLLLTAQLVVAVGLGEISVSSRIGQPLSAEIELTAMPQEQLGDIRFSCADNAAYQARGLNRISLVNDIQFKVERQADGSKVLRLSSRKPVMEPFVELLIEVVGPTVNMVRQYSLLLDLPATSDR